MFVYSAVRTQAALGLIKCPNCEKTRIEVRMVRRKAGQHDGLEGVVGRCRTCGHRWIIKALAPIV